MGKSLVSCFFWDTVYSQYGYFYSAIVLARIVHERTFLRALVLVTIFTMLNVYLKLFTIKMLVQV